MKNSLLAVLCILVGCTGCVKGPLCSGALPPNVTPVAGQKVIYIDKDQQPEYFDYFKCLAHSGHEESQYKLGFAYEKGMGTKIDLKKAMYWYRKAANPKSGLKWMGNSEVALNVGPQTYGNADAQYRIGLIHLLGLGRDKNDDYARLYFKYAADQGHLLAALKLQSLNKSKAEKGKE